MAEFSAKKLETGPNKLSWPEKCLKITKDLQKVAENRLENIFSIIQIQNHKIICSFLAK
jgi:hypothetical protein